MKVVDNEKIERLRIVLDDFSYLFGEVGIEELILKTYRYEKALTDIEIYDKNTQEVYDLVKALKSFFLVGYYQDQDTKDSKFFGEILVSRFSSIFKVAFEYMKKCEGAVDKYADLFGILFGYSPQEVAQYCSKKRMRELSLLF